MSKQIFVEEQAFKGADLLVLAGIIAASLAYLLVKDMVASNFAHPGPDLLALILIIGLVWWMRSLLQQRLKTTVTRKKLICQLTTGATHKEKIPLAKIASCAVVKTPLGAQWSGSNLHYGNEKMFSFTGRNGLAIQTRDGHQYFVGSRRVNELAAAIKQALLADKP
ncbi:MAG: hypothetical protein DA408_10770 [Bacteroidetes bacterium]|nr:MAG: hypothetical protein C7N36_10255 [Bacteroidota bacterium]PTM12437.1 MAG: hypothetical protein DA408_10770 [Bacteroidota bacterium]